MENHCVSCGKVIPEGRQICPDCEDGKIGKTIGMKYEPNENGEWHSEPLILYDDRRCYPD